MRRLPLAVLALAACTSAQTPQSAPTGPRDGRANLPDTAARPFAVTPQGRFDKPFALAFLPDGRLLVTEKGGALKLRGRDGAVVTVTGAPAVAAEGQGGLLDVAVAPDFASSGLIFLSFAEQRPTGTALALARARLTPGPVAVRCASPPAQCPQPMQLEDLRVIWRAGSDGKGGHFGSAIAIAPDGRSLFLTVGDRQRFTPAQDPDQALGKVVHLTLDGAPAADNPGAGRTGAAAIGVIDPPRNSVAAATAPVREWRSPGPNTAPAAAWSIGHRNPYGLAFDGGGRLWELEMGPQGGDELNLIGRGGNYGYPRASNGTNYDGVDIPDHRAGDGFAAPKAWWNPAISPGGMIVYRGAAFPAWRGSALIAALGSKALIRVKLDGERATAADQWDMGARIRDVAEAPDGSVWLLEDGERGSTGRLLKLTAAR